MLRAFDQQSFTQGFESTLSRLIEGQMTKAAVSPRIVANVRANPSLYKAFGEQLFRSAKRPTADIWEGLKATMLPGYGQMNHVAQLQKNHLQDVRYLGNQLKRLVQRDRYTGAVMNASDPRVQSITNLIRNQAGGFRHQRDTAFAQIGATATPRAKFFGALLPATAGIAGGGALAGAAAGVMGNNAGRQNTAQDFANLPLFQRLRYTLMPQDTSARVFHGQK